MQQSKNEESSRVKNVVSSLKKMLSAAGLQGAESRNIPFTALKDWALKEAEKMRGDERGIARKLSARLPNHLAAISKDPMRLIYDTLRAKRK